jgi:DNA-binding response OmpR family regulator
MLVRPSVLVVDDDEDSAFVLEAALELAGFSVRVAFSCREARAALETAPADALVSDLSLGDGDAFDLLASLRSNRPRVAILVTGYGSEEDKARSKAAGFCAHLVKPVQLAQLEHTLRAAVAAPGPPASNPPET